MIKTYSSNEIKQHFENFASRDSKDDIDMNIFSIHIEIQEAADAYSPIWSSHIVQEQYLNTD